MNLPVVFLGPSLPVAEARQYLCADFRPPIRRGELELIPAGRTVGIVDGVFHEELAISPKEIQSALLRGVLLAGASSMGALRAAEVSGVVGIGRIYEWFKNGVIDRDDEVALLFDPISLKALTVPLVNVRFGVQNLVGSGTLRRSTGEEIIKAAARLHYSNRTYPRIMSEAGLGELPDLESLIALFETFDLKKEDARLLLETLPALDTVRQQEPAGNVARGERASVRDSISTDPGPSASDKEPVTVWELGEKVPFDDLILFLQMTGRFEHHARRTILRWMLSGKLFPAGKTSQDISNSGGHQSIFDRARTEWGWVLEEEALVTLQDLGVHLDDLALSCDLEARSAQILYDVIRARNPEFLRELRHELFLTDVALKRETMRCGSLRVIANRSSLRLPPGPKELTDTQSVLCRAAGCHLWEDFSSRLAGYGILEKQIDDFVSTLARCRKSARELRQRIHRRRYGDEGWKSRETQPAGRVRPFHFQSRIKASDDPRFCLPLKEAFRVTPRLRELVGITRVASIGELSQLGVHVSQAARPSNLWSSSYGSGKSESPEGATVGGVLEEVEKWAQEQFDPPDEECHFGTYADLRGRLNCVDPRRLDLPFDSPYREDLPQAWYECWDLLEHRAIYVPRDLVRIRRGKSDIAYSARSGRKVFSTNGLASGFNLEEALVHALCEYIERHARKLADLRINHFSTFDRRPEYRSVERTSCPEPVLRLLERFEPVVTAVDLLDLVCDIHVPTFQARFRSKETGKWSLGWAAHPNPAVALHMALLECAQTTVGNIAGGREDLLIQARSLGRQQGALPNRADSWWFWHDPDRETQPFSNLSGIVTDDANQELQWVLRRLWEAGINQVIAIDLTVDGMKPARAVRVLIPGLETNNPLHAGVRARMALTADLLSPYWT